MNVRYEPIKKVKISEMIQNQIIDMISSGKLPPGSKLPSERDLCESLNVSRASLREAIEGLNALGITEKRPDGTYIKSNLDSLLQTPFNLYVSLNNISMEKVFAAREVLECQNAYIAATEATEEELENMGKIVERLKNSVSDEDIWNNAAQFHMEVAKATHNEILIAAFSMIYLFIAEKPRKEKAVDFDHREVYEAIKSRDAKRARSAMINHLRSVEKNY